MFFEYIRTRNCNRFSIDGKQSVIIRPTAKTQMILGTNGSGKTSLLSIGFSPIPPNPNDFNGDGEWEVHIQHKGRRYELKAEYAGRNAYSFIVDGEELNRDGKITPQLDLTREHLGYTKELEDLLLGRVRFTQLTPQARRDWIARISTSDFAYAFSQYNRFRKGLTASQNLVTWLKSRLNEETQKLILPEDALQMRQQAKELHGEYDRLMREPRCLDTAESIESLERRFLEVTELTERMVLTEYPPVPREGEGDFDTQKLQATDQVNELKGELNVRGQQLEDAQQRLRRVETMLSSDPKLLEVRRQELNQSLSQIPIKRIDLHDSLLIDAPEAIRDLRHALADLPSRTVSQDEYNALQQEVFTKREKANKAFSMMEDIQRQIEHIHRCDAVSCPSCNTTFKPGIAPGTLEELKSRELKGTDVVVRLGAEASEAEDWLRQSTEIVRAYQGLEQLRQRHRQQAQGLFTYLDTKGGLSQGKALLQEIALYEREVNNRIARERITQELEEIETALTRYAQEAGDYQIVQQDYEQCLARYEDTHKRYLEAVRHQTAIEAQIRIALEYDRQAELAETYLADLKKRLITHCHHEKDKLVEETIHKTRSSLGIIEAALAENEVVEGIVKDLTVQLEKATVEEQAYRRLVKEMCPKTGLIAEQIQHQIGAIVQGINQMIKRIWGYPLYIELGDTGEVDLDYRFPIVIEGKRRSDISEGSEAMKEIIDRAFVWTAYYCLDLVDYPLYLDEAGIRFDEVHRQNLIPMIKDLIDSQRFSQILLISHDPDSQTAFPNSQTIILDERNIPNYPFTYNAHVEFV